MGTTPIRVPDSPAEASLIAPAAAREGPLPSYRPYSTQLERLWPRHRSRRPASRSSQTDVPREDEDGAACRIVMTITFLARQWPVHRAISGAVRATSSWRDPTHR